MQLNNFSFPFLFPKPSHTPHALILLQIHGTFFLSMLLYICIYIYVYF